MAQAKLGVFMMAAALGACGNGSDAGEGSNANSGKADVTVPAFVQRMVDADFPADGQVHVQSQGKFEIKPETLFCELPSKVDEKMRTWSINGVGLVKIDRLLRSMGQSISLDGAQRSRMVSSPGCEIEGDQIFHKGFANSNRNGKPYRVVMAVWQGNNYWVGQVGKELDPDDPMTWGPLPYRMGGPHIGMVIVPSIENISAAFVKHVQ